jgi:hypothetical protein
VENHWYRVCRNNDTNVSVTCEVNFSCKGATPANARICSYSSANPDEPKKDDRELNKSGNKQLIKRNEVSANRYARCGGSGDNANP